MVAKTVYLAGPIEGKTPQEALDWRVELGNRLWRVRIKAINPLRNEGPLRQGKYGIDNTSLFSNPGAIWAKNKFDTINCDLVLAYLPAGNFSIGTIWEIGQATAYDAPILIVTDCEKCANHPCLQRSAGWIVETFDEAYDVIRGLFDGY